MGMTGSTVPGVELFATGTYRGKTWTLADLDEMAENAKRLGPHGLKLLHPPAVYGHEETQEFLDRTDWPVAAWLNCESVKVRRYRDPATGQTEGVLVGDLEDVNPEAAAAIKAKKYRKVSSEIYDDFKDDHDRSYGKALRRIALLGGEVPQVKRLKDIPEPVAAFADSRRLVPSDMAVTAEGTWICFAESVPVDRQQMIAAAKSAMPGLAQATLEAMTDDALADLVKNLPAGGATPQATQGIPPQGAALMDENAAPSREEMIAACVEAGEDQATVEALPEEELAALYEEIMSEPPEGGEGGGGEVAEMGDPAMMAREELIAELVAAGQDAAALEAMPDEDLKALYGQVVGGATATAAAAPAPVAAMGERTVRNRQLARFSERDMRRAVNVAKPLEAAANRLYRQVLRQEAQLKSRDAHQFCETLVKNGQVTPAMAKTVVLPLLLSMDSVNEVHKYSENGKTRVVSAYERKKAELTKLPRVVHFGERFPETDDSTQNIEQFGEGEERKVIHFAEVHERALSHGSGKAKYVQVFRELRKKNPRLTAKEYGVPDEFCN